MSAATRQEISDWFDYGKRDDARYMIVACDTFDHNDYPVYADNDDEVVKRFIEIKKAEHHRVMEVYDLQMDRE